MQTQVLDPRSPVGLLVPVAGILIGAGLCAPSSTLREGTRQYSVGLQALEMHLRGNNPKQPSNIGQQSPVTPTKAASASEKVRVYV